MTCGEMDGCATPSAGCEALCWGMGEGTCSHPLAKTRTRQCQGVPAAGTVWECQGHSEITPKCKGVAEDLRNVYTLIEEKTLGLAPCTVIGYLYNN